jgi:serine/threonine protein phosphatase PrpC
MNGFVLKIFNKISDSFGGTHQGRVRPINEDRFLCRGDFGVFVVADGMGGHAHGDIASSAIVQSVNDGMSNLSHDKQLDFFARSIVHANDAIRDISHTNGNIMIGSTMVGLVASEDRFSVMWTGDSRVYLLRDYKIGQLTTDHTEAELLLREGSITAEQAKNWPRKNTIVHAIGVNDRPHIETTNGTIRPSDVFVLCTDGLTKHLTDEEIRVVALSNSAKAACVEMIRVTLERGGTDNVSVIVVKMAN